MENSNLYEEETFYDFNNMVLMQLYFLHFLAKNSDLYLGKDIRGCEQHYYFPSIV